MQAWKVGGGLALGLTAVVVGVSRSPVSAQEEPKWLGDYTEAQAVARQSGKPIFLVFR